MMTEARTGRDAGCADAGDRARQAGQRVDPAELVLGEAVEHRHGDGGEHEQRTPDHEHEVDELRARRRPALLGAEHDLEPGADRRHHPGRRPPEQEQGHEPDEAGRRGDVGDGGGDIVAAGDRRRQRADDRVDDGVVDVLVAEQQAEHGDDHDRERDDRKEHPVGDPGSVLRAGVGEVAVDGGREDAGDLAGRAGARRADAPARGRGIRARSRRCGHLCER